MLRKSPCQSFIQAYDPIGPIRSRESKGNAAETTAEMASTIALLAANNPEGSVSKDDLHRAGFTEAEITRCQAEAVVIASERMAPRQAGIKKAA